MKKSNSYKNSRKSAFIARNSRLDTQTLIHTIAEFRGFVVLFWLAVGISMLNTVVSNWRDEGSLIRLGFMRILSRDLFVFGLSHLTMVTSTFITMPFTKLFVHGWIRNKWLFYFLQVTLESIFLYSCIAWTVYRTWPWPQSATFSLHSVAMCMKMHSYIANNVEFELCRRELFQLESGIKKGTITDPDLNHIKYLREELTKGSTSFPHNMTWYNFWDYLLVPTLVYELEYPRTDNIRFSYILEKIVATMGIVAVLYMSVEHYIGPVLLEMQKQTVLESILQLLIPYMVGWLMIFYVMFECVCNAFAEFTRFADREFYQDWWNSSSFDEFARKWNKPVHEFLLRHVYLEAIDSYKLSKSNATFLTFLFSAFLHELVVAVTAKKIKFVFFTFQMSQIPLIWLGRLPFFKSRPMLGNVFFWLALMSGMPLITILYTRDFYFTESINKDEWNFRLW